MPVHQDQSTADHIAEEVPTFSRVASQDSMANLIEQISPVKQEKDGHETRRLPNCFQNGQRKREGLIKVRKIGARLFDGSDGAQPTKQPEMIVDDLLASNHDGEPLEELISEES